MTDLPTLSRNLLPDLPSFPEKMIQFGGGNFMRGFVDWQLQRMNDQGLFGGSAVLVQAVSPRTDPQFAEQDCLFTVLLSGIRGGETVDTAEVVASVSRLINPYNDYAAYLSLADDPELTLITSNTTEAGLVYRYEERPEAIAPAGFPGKLTALLHRRFSLGGPGFMIIPCELIERNGEQLREIVRRHADDWQLGEEFKRWLDTDNAFCSSLVDRIVPGFPRGREAELEARLGYVDKLAVAAEPYLLWIIEGPESLRDSLPLAQAGLNVIVTTDMTPYRERKVHLLNGPHTAMVPLALPAGLETVEDVMNDAHFSPFVHALIEQELIPMLDMPTAELEDYAGDVLDRFRNPSIRHELRSISLNSVSKFKSRLLPILLRFVRERGELPPRLTLAFAALLRSGRDDGDRRRDEASVLAAFDRAGAAPSSFVPTLLGDTSLWGTDLNEVPGLADRLENLLDVLEKDGPRALLRRIAQGGIHA